MKMDWNRYGSKKRWEKHIRPAILRRAGERRDAQGRITQQARCEQCRIENHSIRPNGVKVVLTTAHLGAPFATGDGWRPGDPTDKGDIRAENLAALCQREHFALDQAEHKQNRAETRRKQREQAGQLVLLAWDEEASA